MRAVALIAALLVAVIAAVAYAEFVPAPQQWVPWKSGPLGGTYA